MMQKKRAKTLKNVAVGTPVFSLRFINKWRRIVRITKRILMPPKPPGPTTMSITATTTIIPSSRVHVFFLGSCIDSQTIRIQTRHGPEPPPRFSGKCQGNFPGHFRTFLDIFGLFPVFSRKYPGNFQPTLAPTYVNARPIIPIKANMCYPFFC